MTGSSLSIGAIVGIVVAGTFAVAIVVGILCAHAARQSQEQLKEPLSEKQQQLGQASCTPRFQPLALSTTTSCFDASSALEPDSDFKWWWRRRWQRLQLSGEMPRGLLLLFHRHDPNGKRNKLQRRQPSVPRIVSSSHAVFLPTEADDGVSNGSMIFTGSFSTIHDLHSIASNVHASNTTLVPVTSLNHRTSCPPPRPQPPPPELRIVPQCNQGCSKMPPWAHSQSMPNMRQPNLQQQYQEYQQQNQAECQQEYQQYPQFGRYDCPSCGPVHGPQVKLMTPSSSRPTPRLPPPSYFVPGRPDQHIPPISFQWQQSQQQQHHQNISPLRLQSAQQLSQDKQRMPMRAPRSLSQNFNLTTDSALSEILQSTERRLLQLQTKQAFKEGPQQSFPDAEDDIFTSPPVNGIRQLRCVNPEASSPSPVPVHLEAEESPRSSQQSNKSYQSCQSDVDSIFFPDQRLSQVDGMTTALSSPSHSPVRTTAPAGVFAQPPPRMLLPVSLPPPPRIITTETCDTNASSPESGSLSEFSSPPSTPSSLSTVYSMDERSDGKPETKPITDSRDEEEKEDEEEGNQLLDNRNRQRRPASRIDIMPGVPEDREAAAIAAMVAIIEPVAAIRPLKRPLPPVPARLSAVTLAQQQQLESAQDCRASTLTANSLLATAVELRRMNSVVHSEASTTTTVTAYSEAPSVSPLPPQRAVFTMTPVAERTSMGAPVSNATARCSRRMRLSNTGVQGGIAEGRCGSRSSMGGSRNYLALGAKRISQLTPEAPEQSIRRVERDPEEEEEDCSSDIQGIGNKENRSVPTGGRLSMQQLPSTERKKGSMQTILASTPKQSKSRSTSRSPSRKSPIRVTPGSRSPTKGKTAEYAFVRTPTRLSPGCRESLGLYDKDGFLIGSSPAGYREMMD